MFMLAMHLHCKLAPVSRGIRVMQTQHSLALKKQMGKEAAASFCGMKDFNFKARIEAEELLPYTDEVVQLFSGTKRKKQTLCLCLIIGI